MWITAGCAVPSGDQFNSGRCASKKFGLIVITGAQWLCKPRVGVRFPVGPPYKNTLSDYTGTTEILANSRQSKDQPGREGSPRIQAPQCVSIWYDGDMT